MKKFIEEKVQEIKELVKDDTVILALSGGVDSSVCASLISKAIGNKLICVFVDHGLLRANEFENVKKIFENKVNLIAIDAKDRFLDKLKGVVDAEAKRKIIGHEFINVFTEVANSLNGIKYLAQGTIYADIAESGDSTHKLVKSHHNVGGLPEKLGFTLIEPLKTLYKNQVREVGELLGLPSEIINRQPFPGPGLGIRIMGEVTFEALRLVRESDLILREEVKKHNLNIWQYFTVLPNVKTVGVKNDNRCYEDIIVIRAVTSSDGMTASVYPIDYQILEKISTRIIKEVSGINRVCLDITQKPPGTIEWE